MKGKGAGLVDPNQKNREKGEVVRRGRRLLWSGMPNPNYKPISLRLPPEKR